MPITILPREKGWGETIGEGFGVLTQGLLEGKAQQMQRRQAAVAQRNFEIQEQYRREQQVRALHEMERRESESLYNLGIELGGDPELLMIAAKAGLGMMKEAISDLSKKEELSLLQKLGITSSKGSVWRLPQRTNVQVAGSILGPVIVFCIICIFMRKIFIKNFKV